MDKILTARDFVKTMGFDSLRDYYRARTSAPGYETPFVDAEPEGEPVDAFVDYGRWIARCECGGAEAVDYDDPIFYCLACGNMTNNGKPRPVNMPDEWQEIERLLLKRPVRLRGGRNAFERATMAEPVVSTEHGQLSRTWLPGETLDDIKRQNNALEKGRK